MNRGAAGFRLGNISVTRAGMSTKSKRPSHYEALELDSRATSNEIKAAYFELSKKYHPDKNSSEEAVEKFRNITEAYEVLGGYKTRRIYDRGLAVKSRSDALRSQDKPKRDENIEYYRKHAAAFRSPTKTGTIPHYDVDMWMKSHYGRTFRRINIDRSEGMMRRNMREESHIPQTAVSDIILMGISVLIIVSLFIMADSIHKYDEVKVDWKQEKASKDVPAKESSL